VPVTLLASLAGDRFGPEALADARQRAERAGYTLRRVDGPDDHLAAWIDAQFPGTTWSSEAYESSAWVALRGREIAGFAAFGKPLDRHCRWLATWRNRDDLAMVGPIGIVAGDRGAGVGAPLLVATLATLREQGYGYALFPAASGERFIAMVSHVAGARIVDSFPYEFRHRHRATILASGAGTNARNVLQRVAAGALPLDVDALIAGRADAGALLVASEHDVPALALPWERAAESRASYDTRLEAAVARTEPDLVLLLGWMHVLSTEFLTRFPQTINVHPAFLPLDPGADTVVAPDGTTIPALRGAHALRDALEQRVRWVGATVHHVTPEIDRGAVLVRVPVAVGETTSEAALRERVRPAEFTAVEAGIRRWAGPREEEVA
jgi:phosphoribosylglycinamide formyltransferase-1